MSDTIAAPAPADVTAPAQNETPIETNPVSLPSPVGSQAPDKPPEARHPSRREAIQAAYERASNPQKAKAEAKVPLPVAEAKPGHNHPPEATEKLDLKKRPSDQPRGDRGQFAARSATAPSSTPSSVSESVPASVQGASTDTPPGPQLPADAPYREAPPRMAEHARAQWHATPEPVRGEIHRMQAEFGNAYNYYRGVHEAFQPIAGFHQMAQQHGTTLEKALTNYVGMEQKLRADPVAGLDQIIYNLDLKTPDGQRLGLRDIAYHVLTQSPDQLLALQQGNQQTAAARQIGALHQEVRGLKDSLTQMHNQQRFASTRAGIDQFAANGHPRVDELADLIEQEIKLGFDLDTAYRRAELLRPSTQVAQTHTPSAQTRPSTDRSISGAPASSGNGAAHLRLNKPVGRREAIEHAMKQVGGF